MEYIWDVPRCCRTYQIFQFSFCLAGWRTSLESTLTYLFLSVTEKRYIADEKMIYDNSAGLERQKGNRKEVQCGYARELELL